MDRAEAFKLFVVFFSSQAFSLLYFILVPPILCSFLIPFYPLFCFVLLHFFSFLFFLEDSTFLHLLHPQFELLQHSQSFSVCFHLICVSAKTTAALHGAELVSSPSILPVSKSFGEENRNFFSGGSNPKNC